MKTAKLNRDGVETAFALIIDEIEIVAGEIATQGSAAFRDKAYDLARQLSENGKHLQGFRAKVQSLLKEWRSGIDRATRRRFSQRCIQGGGWKIAHHRKKLKKRLRVAFKDGTTIEKTCAAETFALSLHHIGYARIETLGLKQYGIPLIGNVKSAKYQQCHMGGKYILTHTSTRVKKDTLNLIGKRLGVGLEVKVIE